MGITKKQKEIYDYICSYNKANGIAPTQKEIKEHFGFKSFGSVQRYIKYLTEAGYLEADWNARRGLKAVEPSQSSAPQVDIPDYMAEVPLLGKVAAGIPIEAIETCDNMVAIPKNMMKSSHHKYFALTVQGDSMIEDGILEDDIVVCRSQNTANQGQTIVALIEGEATLKTMFRKKGIIELHPANSTMEPILVDQHSGDFKIAGVLVGLLRSYE